MYGLLSAINAEHDPLGSNRVAMRLFEESGLADLPMNRLTRAYLSSLCGSIEMLAEGLALMDRSVERAEAMRDVAGLTPAEYRGLAIIRIGAEALDAVDVMQSTP